jgi:hypothetical protein
MSTPDQDQTPVAGGEQLFIRNALASVERAARFSRIKRIVVTVIAFPVLYYLTGSAPEHRVAFTVIMVIGVMLVAITSKIVAKLDSNTRTILRAIAELPQKK